VFAERCPDYPRTIIANARALGARLAGQGLPPEGAAFGYSKGHQLWVRTEVHGIAAAEAAGRLAAAGIHVNFLTDLPAISEPALRIGLNEPTWLGLQPADIPELASIMTAAIFATSPHRDLAERAAALRSGLPGNHIPPSLHGLSRQILHATIGGLTTETEVAAP